MSRPWDNEPTPITNQAVIDTHGRWTFELRERMADLERRLRHAEELLKRFRRGETSISAIETLHNDNIAHLEAARQEDA